MKARHLLAIVLGCFVGNVIGRVVVMGLEAHFGPDAPAATSLPRLSQIDYEKPVWVRMDPDDFARYSASRWAVIVSQDPEHRRYGVYER